MHRYHKSIGDRIFDLIVYLFAALIIIITLYPLIYTISMSISDPAMAARGKVWFLPIGFDLSAIKTVLNDDGILRYYYNTLWYTLVGTVLGVIVTCLGAYPLSRKEFKHRNIFTKAIMFTMFFGGGLVPTYIVVTSYLHLYNNRWAIILPTLTAAWYIIVARSFFESLPDEIVESARIDGASEFRIFIQLVMPLSKPIIAVLALYFAVGYWNSYFPSLLYLGKKELQPLALYVRSVVIQSSLGDMNAAVSTMLNPESMLSALQIKYAVVVVSIVPMLLIYPFLSKNLEKGLMIGAVKG